MREIAQAAIAHPTDMALSTVAEVAKRTGVQPSSVVRFAQAFGYPGFVDMQAVFRSRLIAQSPSYRDRIEALRHEHNVRHLSGPGASLNEFVDDGIAALHQLRDTISAKDLARASEILAAADEIYVLGHWRSFPVAYYIAYALNRFDLRGQLLDGVGGMTPERLRLARRSDALVAISFKEYSLPVVEWVTAAAARGIPVIAITDSSLSPLARCAKVSFEVESGDAQPFRSLVAPICLAQTLVVSLGERLADRAA
jgi:DNA-binding MurR/RpiR family transcriptional regulator